MKKQGLPNFELEAMMIIWNAPDAINTGDILRQMTTQCRLQALQSILKRLERKGYLKLEKRGHLNYYTPLVKREDYTVQEMHSFIDRLYDSSPIRLAASLVEDCELEEHELEQLQRLIDAAKEKANKC